MRPRNLLQAQAAQGGFMSFLPLILIVLVFWFFMIRPQAKRQKELKKFREALQKGDKVVTLGGIFGKIVEINNDTNTVIMEIESQARMKVSKEAIVKDTTDVPLAR